MIPTAKTNKRHTCGMDICDIDTCRNIWYVSLGQISGVTCITLSFSNGYTLHLLERNGVSWQLQIIWQSWPQAAICWIGYVHPMTPWHGNPFYTTGPLSGEFTIHRRFPLPMARNLKLWYVLLSWTSWWICILWLKPLLPLTRHCDELCEESHQLIPGMQCVIFKSNMKHWNKT